MPALANILMEHPRVCGENTGYTVGPGTLIGTSPRMRGKRATYPSPDSPIWNIPAYAGKTVVAVTIVFFLPEHPRVCGENVLPILQFRIDIGTSPRMRGKQSSFFTQSLQTRNIPAYAGKTRLRYPKPTPPQEHPRVCGENKGGNAFTTPSKGTSPRMRGKPTGGAKVGSEIRNIPAYAGKTYAC